MIEHIIEWAELHEHKFENLIVLCATFHGRKRDTSDPRQGRKSLRCAFSANIADDTWRAEA